MAVTIKDVAKRAGVTHPTVSRALRGDRRVSPQTTTRIRQIAHDLGYIPSATARSLKTNRTRVVGIVAHRLSDPFYSRVIDGIQDALQAEGYSIFLAATNHNPEREAQLVRAMTERRVDGLIVCSLFITPEYRQAINSHNIPLVVIHNRAAEITPFTLYHDDRWATRLMTRHLLDLGHTRIGFLGNARAGRVSRARQAGFVEEMQAAGIEPDENAIVQAALASPAAGAEPVRHLLALPLPLTALVCFNDVLAIGAIRVLQQAHKRVPEDFSVTGFDNIEMAEYMNPPLTTFDQPKYSLGTRAANLLLSAIHAPDGQEAAANVLTLRGEIIVRASTARVPSMTLVQRM